MFVGFHDYQVSRWAADGQMADVCNESLAPSSVDYKFVRQFVGEGDRRRARAASPATAAPLSRELTAQDG